MLWRIIKQNTGLFWGRNTYAMAREELSDNVTFEQRPGAVRKEPCGHLEKAIPGREVGMCTGPELDAQVMCVRTSQEASVAGAEWARGVIETRPGNHGCGSGRLAPAHV